MRSYRLTELQRQMWFGAMLFAGTPAYMLSVCFHVRFIDPERFQRAVRSVLRADPLLSLRVRGTPEQPVFQIGEPDSIAYRDLRGEPIDVLNSLTDERRNLTVDPAKQTIDSLLVRTGAEEYRWYLSLPHLFVDGWAVKAIVDRVSRRYDEPEQSADSPLCGNETDGPLVYLVERDRYLASPEFAIDEQYWNSKLTPFTPPTDFYGLPRSREEGCHKTFVTLDSRLSGLVRTIAEGFGLGNQNVALSNFFAASLLVYLYKLTGEGSLSIGMPFSNRRTERQRASLGLRMQIGVLRVSIEEGESFRSLVASVAAESAAAHQHMRYPLNNIRNRLYDVMLNYHNLRYGQIAGYVVREEWLRSGDEAIPFTLHVRTDGEAGFRLEFDLQQAIFNEQMRRQAVGDFLRVVEQVAKDPAIPLGRIRLCDLPSPLSVESGSSPLHGLAGEQLHELFTATASQRPDQAAVYDRGKRTTFRELQQRAGKIRDALVEAGCRSGSIVGLLLHRSAGSIAAILGILEAQGVWLPLDPDYPPSRLQFILADCGCDLVVAESSSAEGLGRNEIPASGTQRKGAASLTVLPVDRDTGELARYARRGAMAPRSSDRRPAVALSAQGSGFTSARAAYCLYTSGSTGRPKGVLGSHEAALNRIRWMWRELPFENDEVLLQKTSLSFIDSVWEIFGALLAGRATVIASDETLRDPKRLRSLVARYPIRRIILVPTLLRSLLDSPGGLRNGFERISRWFVTGELFSADLARRLMRELPNAEVYNLFGTTETYDAACHRVEERDLEGSIIPVGRPIDNMELFVLDSSLNPLPVGVRGDLFVSGIGVVDGYVGRPKLSARKFLPSASGSRLLFRTGDAARMLPEGRFQCLGRLDTLVKLRGFRIELEEIERVLEALPDVVEALAAVENERLLAFVTLRQGASTQAAQLRRELRERVPAWMVPVIRIVRSLPLTPSGKRPRNRSDVERLSFPADDERAGGPAEDGAEECDSAVVTLGAAEPEVRQDTAAVLGPLQRAVRRGSTRDPLEASLLRIWREILTVDEVEPFDDFFDLGGNSLLAVRLVAEIERRLDIHLPLSALFESPSVHRLVAEQLRGRARAVHLPVPIRIGRPGRTPLFSVPPAGSTVSAFGALARYLPDDQPLYSFQPEGVERGEAPHLSIEEMARDYVEQMRGVQPEGPYLLAGRCFGGYVAYEMAQQLRAQGEAVAALLIIDSPEAPLEASEQQCHVGIRKLLNYYPGRIRYFLRQRRFFYALRMKMRNELSFGLGTLSDLLPTSLFDSRERRLRVLRHLHTLAYHRYVAKPYPDLITIFRAEQTPDLTGERKKWEKLASGGVEWHEVAAGHYDLLREPNIRAVGAEMSECLRRVQAELEKGALA